VIENSAKTFDKDVNVQPNLSQMLDKKLVKENNLGRRPPRQSAVSRPRYTERGGDQP
jgi:hypothetical protein